MATSPEQQPYVFAAAFNTGDPDAIERVYEAGGVFVDGPGQPTTGADRREANARMAALGLPIEVKPRHVYVADDIALLIVDWAIRGTSSDGEEVDIPGNRHGCGATRRGRNLALRHRQPVRNGDPEAVTWLPQPPL